MEKSIIVFCIIIFLVAGCKKNSKKETETIVVSDNFASDTETKNITTPDNSSNALDWQGTYSGILPCADCEGIKTSITLNNDLTYTMTTKYLGKKEITKTEKKGTFVWNKGGINITLNGIENAPAQYLVGENKLIQLDMKGNRISGETAEKYQLRKN